MSGTEDLLLAITEHELVLYNISRSLTPFPLKVEKLPPPPRGRVVPVFKMSVDEERDIVAISTQAGIHIYGCTFLFFSPSSSLFLLFFFFSLIFSFPSQGAISH